MGLSGCHVKWAVLKINKKKKEKGENWKSAARGREREKRALFIN